MVTVTIKLNDWYGSHAIEVLGEDYLLKPTFDEYEAWCKTHTRKSDQVWYRWNPGYKHFQVSYPGEQQSVTQTEMLQLHFEKWLDDPDEAHFRMADTIIKFFESIEARWALAVLGEEYFA